MDTNISDKEIEKVKRKIIKYYILFISSVVLFFIVYHLFFAIDKVLSYYLIGGLLFLIYTWTIIRKDYNIKKLVNTYFIISPLYFMFILLRLWEASVVGFIWYLYLPLGAYIFFDSKRVIYYSLYTVFLIIVSYSIARFFHIHFINYAINTDRSAIDVLVYIFNIFILGFALFYGDKIRMLKLEKKLTLYKTLPRKDESNSSFNEHLKLDEIFKIIEKSMEEDMLFKNPEISIISLSLSLNISTKNITKAIKINGFDNFNHYINFHRISLIKNLFNEFDLDKVTLMYLYTNAGFTSQTTFNRVFKQIEGITPSEYLNKIKEVNKMEH